MLSTQWHAIVPAKRLVESKSRLGRIDLSIPFLTDVLTALTESTQIADITVVTRDSTIADIAFGLNCAVAEEISESGLLPAINQGIQSLPAADQAHIVVVLGDVPCLTAADVSKFIAAGAKYPCAFLSDAEGTGSTMWMRTTNTSHLPCFGPRSRAAHREAGAVEIHGPHFASARRDVDTEVNLWDAIRLGLGKSTTTALQGQSTPPSAVLTIASTEPLTAVDESGHIRHLDSGDIAPLRAVRVGQRVVVAR